MEVGDLVKVFQRMAPSRFNHLLDRWEQVCEGLVIDHITDDDGDKGVVSIYDKSGAVQRVDLSQYRMSQANKKRMMFKVEVISEG